MSTVNIAVVEDNSQDYIRLKECLDSYCHTAHTDFSIHHFDSGESFLRSEIPFHLIFMDIELPGINGLETSKRLREKNEDAVLVLITNMVQYAIHGYEVRAVDYIVKPVIYEQLSLKMTGFLSQIKKKQKTIVIRHKNVVTKLLIRQIRYIEIFKHYVLIQLEKDNTLSTRGSLREYEDSLSECGFTKCNQGCLVNLYYVQSFSDDTVVVDGHSLPLSRRVKKSFSDTFIRYEKEW